MQLRRSAADLSAAVRGVDPADGGADGGDNRRARAAASVAAGLRMP